MQVNGNSVQEQAGMCLLEYLQQQNYQLERIAVEYNGDILVRAQYAEIILQPEDHIEIVSFVGGG